jgi:putative restriction endonuclease
MTESKYGSIWSREELILALFLYCQIPFAKTTAKNPEVIRLAKVLERTPASIARKLGNFGAFDPFLAAQGISGLSHGGRGDKAVWNEFHHRWGSLVAESSAILATMPEGVTVTDRDDQILAAIHEAI